MSSVVNESFVLDVIESKGRPMVYAARVGEPRLAVFGQRTALNMPMTFSAFDHALTIANAAEQPQYLSIFYRGDELAAPVKTLSRPYVAELASRLGGAGDEKLQFGYGDVVAILQSMSDAGKLGGAFVLQDMPSVEEFSTSADLAGGAVRPSGETGTDADVAPSKATAVGANTTERPGNGTPAGRAN
jgi:hypothetical protein